MKPAPKLDRKTARRIAEALMVNGWLPIPQWSPGAAGCAQRFAVENYILRAANATAKSPRKANAGKGGRT